MEEFLKQLRLIKKGVDFENETALFDDGFLDSFDVIQIIALIDDEYDITVPPSEIVPKNFNSAKAMWKMMERLENR